MTRMTVVPSFLPQTDHEAECPIGVETRPSNTPDCRAPVKTRYKPPTRKTAACHLAPETPCG